MNLNTSPVFVILPQVPLHRRSNSHLFVANRAAQLRIFEDLLFVFVSPGITGERGDAVVQPAAERFRV